MFNLHNIKLTVKTHQKKLAIAALLFLILFTPLFIYLARAPVIIVSDLSSIPLYGQARIRSQTRNASLSLFRRVKTVAVADNAADDIVRFAVGEVSSRPYCVIFPLRFARSARLYRENNPKISVILLEGRHEKDSIISGIGGNPNDFFIYKTDTEDEFQRAARIAAVLDNGKNGKIAVFINQNEQLQTQGAFLQAINSMEVQPDAVFFTSFDDFSEIPNLTCAVLAGTGVEFMEDNQDIPVIFFTWIEPSLMPDNVVILINDSPWAQAVQAVKMMGEKHTQGQIYSKFEIINKKNIDRQTLHKLKKYCTI